MIEKERQENVHSNLTMGIFLDDNPIAISLYRWSAELPTEEIQ